MRYWMFEFPPRSTGRCTRPVAGSATTARAGHSPAAAPACRSRRASALTRSPAGRSRPRTTSPKQWREDNTMPMRPGQRVRECIDGDGAIDALTQLANRNPPISTIIDDLGRRVLNLPGVCLRNRTRTYALAFVRRRSLRQPHSRSKAFVGFNTDDPGERWMRAQSDTFTSGRLCQPRRAD